MLTEGRIRTGLTPIVSFRNLLYNMKTWSVEYKGHKIEVHNGGRHGDQLLVDGELQDRITGLTLQSRLVGRIRFGDGEGEQIRVSLGGMFAVKRHIFVDDKHLFTG